MLFRSYKPSFVIQVVTADDLDKLLRHPDCEKEYIDWAKDIKAHYGGLENYIVKERLGWDKGDLPLVESNASPTQFFNDIIMNDLSNIKVVFNDWPYGIPLDCKHYVVWCKYPIISPALFASPDTPFPPGRSREILLKAITADGIRGETGSVNKRLPIIGDKTSAIVKDALEFPEMANNPASISPLGETGLGPASDLAEAAHLWAGRFVKKFICHFWDPREYETVSFCNPAHLRTVPGISHFHVISRKKQAKDS